VEGRRSSGNRPADWRGVVPAATEQQEGRGDLRRESGGVRVFSRRLSGPVPAFLTSGVPERTPGAGDGLSSPDGLKAKSRGKRGAGGAAGPNNAVRMKKMAAGGLVGETAGDSLTYKQRFGDTPKTYKWRCSILKIN
jgi:hypothetical protein